MREPCYKPTPAGSHCPYEDVGGPCWGETTLADEADTESQHISYYACCGHVDVALYGFAKLYIRKPYQKVADEKNPEEGGISGETG